MDYEVILSLLTLVALQNVLGIDNELFISLSTDRLAEPNRKSARRIGILLAAAFRIGLLFAFNIFLGSEKTLFSAGDYSFSLKSLLLIAGGIFLIYSSTKEIYRHMEPDKQPAKKSGAVSFVNVLIHIITINLLFSMESVIIAIGVGQERWVMYTAVCIGIVLMLASSLNMSRFLKLHPSLKGLSFCFLFLIGFSLICEGFEIDVPKGYIYFIMVFAIIIDLIQMKLKGRKITPAH
ncbi:MAG: TerC family protein [Bacteroidia bacterium]